MHAGQGRAGHVQPDGDAAGREQHLVGVDADAARQHHAAVGGVERGDRVVEDEVDGDVHPVLPRPQRRRRDGGRPAQHLLRQRRALVGQPALVPDEEDPVVEPLLAQRLGGAGASQPAPTIT
ncbi:hypothetical protein BJF78_12140 [Pseudonocardia sp. CNS-139]|nr:hypothetical protein BJF78_12140 [Pseudonocardia sp. CNS-139]